ncbi:precorrin-2 dehydrogenase/sirohydrochlorin ferrochelatase family protein [Sphingomonas japonica]|nr:bifunctional precorrin-2 dehydrogenase/sirohydrochlorin ferrochelatase [Sphingomonas japonica]
MNGAALPVTLNLSGMPVLLLGKGAAADAKRRLLERAGATIADSPDRARVAIVAIDDADAARGEALALKARGLLVNVVDTPELCDFTVPAIVERAPLLVAVATGGVSAGLAAAVRQRIETLLPVGLGDLARQLHAARSELRARFPDGGERRRAIGAALAPGGALDVLADHDGGAVARWLAEDGQAPADRIEAITLASPDPDELTLRSARLLGQADRVFHRADVPLAILDRARADADRIVCDALPADPGSGLSIDLSVSA